MEEVLLGVAGVRAEMGCGEVVQFFELRPAAEEIELAEGFHDPNVNRESGLEAVGEEEHAIGDLASYPW